MKKTKQPPKTPINNPQIDQLAKAVQSNISKIG